MVTALPKPTVKCTVQAGKNTEVYQHLEWKASDIDDDMLELREGETLFDLDQDRFYTKIR